MYYLQASPLLSQPSVFGFFFLRFYLYTFREMGREGEGEKHQSVASHTPPTGDLAWNPSMWPDWESNQWPFGSQASTQSTEPHQPGLPASLEEEKHCLPIVYFLGLLLPTTAAVKTNGYGLSTGAPAPYRTHHGKACPSVTGTGLLFTVSVAKPCGSLETEPLCSGQQVRQTLFSIAPDTECSLLVFLFTF